MTAPKIVGDLVADGCQCGDPGPNYLVDAEGNVVSTTIEIVGDGFDENEAVGVSVHAEYDRVMISGNFHGDPFSISNDAEGAFQMAKALIECCYEISERCEPLSVGT